MGSTPASSTTLLNQGAPVAPFFIARSLTLHVRWGLL